MSHTINVLIADDHAIVREGLKQILAKEPALCVAGEASNGLEALALVRRRHWDMVLLDISMPGKSGLEVLKLIKDEKPDLPVLILSIYPEDQYALRILKAGASGYLTKESAPSQLVAAILKVAGGGKYISQEMAERLVNDLQTDAGKKPHETLSDREFEILRLIASGKTLSQIAEVLPLSIKTVSTYRARILEKMHMQNNAELINYAIKNGLVF